MVNHRLAITATRAVASLVALFTTLSAHAQESVAEPTILKKVPAVGGQPAFAIAVQGEHLVATLCAGGHCDWPNAVDLGAPAEVVHAASAEQIAVLELAQARHAVHLRAQSPTGSWESLLVAAPRAKQVEVLFAGFTGYTAGDPGDRSGQAIEISDLPRGRKEIVVGELSESVRLCGRDALLSPKVLYPPELKLRGIRLQRLPLAERDKAPVVNAVPRDEATPVGLLSAVGASTNAKAVSALTDGDPNTAWSEKRGEDGRGEFVVFHAPKNVPLAAIDLSIKPTSQAEPTGAAPKTLWLVTDHDLFQVNIPADAWNGGHNQWRIPLTDPLRSDCLALVLDTAYAPTQSKGAPLEKEDAHATSIDVTLAEVGAESAMTAAEIQGLVTDLSSPAAQAVTASEALAALGSTAYSALLTGLPSLSAAGRQRAWNLLETAPCDAVAPVALRAFVRAHLEQQSTPEREAAEKQLRRCPGPVGGEFEKALNLAKAPLAEELSRILADVDPTRYVNAAIPLLEQSTAPKRRALRAQLERALGDRNALLTAQRWLADSKLGTNAAVDVLRLSPKLLDRLAPYSVEKTLELLGPSADFRTRYLLLDSLAWAAAKDSRAVLRFAYAVQKDPEAPVRARAARIAPPVSGMVPQLVSAMNDPEVRVREAAILNAAEHKLNAARSRLLERLREDQWPIVRAATLRALRELPPGEDITLAIANAADEDESAEVRRPAVVALSALDATSQLPVIRDRFESDVDPFVQAAAASALGALCDRASIEGLTDEALKLTHFGGSDRDGIVGTASLAALGRLHPKDLKNRLAPFFQPEVPVFIRGAAQTALSNSDPCKP
ncbi:MAG TPA: HEAT repeat domain-containing protein [Polyangiaceae bacterium]|nr:HEAT repeat domain-containing protein [Polyangiaceae bacterium]